MLEKVKHLIQKKRIKEAKILCEKLSLQNKKKTDVWILLAKIYQELEQSGKAEKCYRKIIKLKSNYAPAHTDIAMLYHSQGKFKKSEPYYRQSLKLNKNQPSVYFNLGIILQELGKLDEAIAQYRQAIHFKKNYVKAYANLGYLLRQQNRNDEAINCYRTALELAPNIPEIHYNLGWALLDVGQAMGAKKHQLKAIELQTDYANAWAGLGAVHFFNDDAKRALSTYQKAFQLNENDIDIICGYSKILCAQPDHKMAMKLAMKALLLEPDNVLANLTIAETCVAMGQQDKVYSYCNKILKKLPHHEEAICIVADAHEKQGNVEQAYKLIQPVLQKKHCSIKAVLVLASICKPLKLEAEAINRLEKILRNSAAIQHSLLRKLHFALGKIYDDLANYDAAFNHFVTGNNLKPGTFDISSLQQNINILINVFSSDFSQHLPKTSIRSSRPVFIIGMPRSGTSLLEQILSSHPEVTAAGELPHINRLSESIPALCQSDSYYASCLKKLTTHHLNELAQSYLEHLNNIDSDALRITDKMPSNFMHPGLIQLLFPDARIIHCVRNPLDTCLSCYFQDFSDSHPWIYDLEDLGKVYLEYQRLMQHWNTVLKIPVLEVSYEGLVDNQEEMSRQIIEFCDLDWDDACLEFHKNNRFAKTASYNQVRQPMYNKSVNRWKNYEPHLKPLTDIFEA